MFFLSCSIAAGLFLAFSNGANDNFKGVATLYGSQTASYKVSLSWATVTTLAGCLTAVIFAQELLSNFSGRGLVPEHVVADPLFPIAVAFAAGMTVLFATKLGFPVSTTHAIVGALMGAGLIASSSGINTSKLFGTFFLPLLVSPVLSVLVTGALYPLFRFIRQRLGVERKSCLCIGQEVLQLAPAQMSVGSMRASVLIPQLPELSVGTQVTCEERYTGNVFGVSAKPVLDKAHFVTAGLVGFSRGLNDAPKIAAIMLASGVVSGFVAVSMVAVVMAFGGLLYSRKIAQTMSYDITKMNDGQGFTSNLVTGLIVIGASRFGLPVSTTHVSCGSLFGIGLITRQARFATISKIILSWITTLPLAAALGAGFFYLLSYIL